jgi:phosphatidylglycerophosphatase A
MEAMGGLGVRFLALLATAGGFGFSPIIPGTMGTIPALCVYLAIAILTPSEQHTLLIGMAFVVSCLFTVALGGWAERHWGRKDPRPFVLDEVAGYLLTVLLFRSSSAVATAGWAFLASRAFDVIKPWPASRMEALSGGLGILMDDLVASLYGVAFLHGGAYLFTTFLPKIT